MFHKKHTEENQEYKLIDAKKILNALGGKENIVEISNCITRLRLKVKDVDIVDVDALKNQTGAVDVIMDQNRIQVIYGLKIEVIRKAIDIEMENQ